MSNRAVNNRAAGAAGREQPGRGAVAGRKRPGRGTVAGRKRPGRGAVAGRKRPGRGTVARDGGAGRWRGREAGLVAASEQSAQIPRPGGP